MGTVRVHKTKNFTVMSNFHFKEKGMSLKAKGLLSLMLSLPDDWNYSISGLVKLSRDGKDSVMSALAELEKFGYLTRERITNEKGQFSGVEYNIFEEPQQDLPISAKQNEDKQKSEKQSSENPPQLNTNSINDLNNKELYELITKRVGDRGLQKQFEDYIEMRENIHSPLTVGGLEKLIERCDRLSKGSVKIQKLMLETAIINNWKNVYQPNENDLAVVSKDLAEELESLLGLE